MMRLRALLPYLRRARDFGEHADDRNQNAKEHDLFQVRPPRTHP
jgi:hypothetical protein